MRQMLVVAGFCLAALQGSSVHAAPLPALEAEVVEVRQLLRENRVEDAIARGESVVEALPQSGNAWLWLGNAYGRKALSANLLSKAGWAGKCRDAYQKAVELAPDNPDARFSLMQYYAQAPGFLGGGRDKAEAQVVELNRIGPAWGHMGRAVLLLSEDNDDEALLAYRAAVDSDPANHRAVLGLISFHLSAKRAADARAAADAALARDPQDPVGLYMIGRIAVEDGVRIEDGIRGLDAYIGLAARPDELPLAAAWWRKGLLLEQAGRKAEALDALQQAVLLDAKLEGAKKDLQRLRS